MYTAHCKQVLILNMTREIITEELSGSMERKLNNNYEALAHRTMVTYFL